MSKREQTVHTILMILAAACFIALICILDLDGDWWVTTVISLFFGFLLFGGIAYYLGNKTSVQSHLAAIAACFFAWTHNVLHVRTYLGAPCARMKREAGGYIELYNLIHEKYLEG